MLFRRNKFVFNLHLLLSFLATLPLLIITLSAVFVQYQNEIIGVVNSSNLKVEPLDEKRLKPSEILENIIKKYEKIGFASMQISSLKDDALIARIQTTNSLQTLFINPYTGDIKEDKTRQVAQFMLMLHRNLALSFMQNDTARIAGKHIVAISTVSLVLLILSGIWLYMPLLRRGIKNAMSISFKSRGYAFLYKIHGVLGVWCALFLLIMALTGLYWSYGFIKNGVNKAFGLQTASMSHKHHKRAFNPLDSEKFKYIDEIYDDSNLRDTTLVVQGGIYSVRHDKGDERFFKVAKNGKLMEFSSEIKVEPNKNDSKFKTPRDVSRFVLSIHQGDVFGEVGRAIFSLVCILFCILTISGFMLTFKRINR
ncbi:PepSY domain-containing protein [Campylobacter sp. RM9344]|uniref:PepSY domain-containing protein n=1 Tax=Campylobacter californiensis TaxID=1032243 RepID=A0AAW3ZT43_9BACT|nr:MULTISPECIES: PepSY-associated TM helix domain-containing protein [unclassified Campylobacter]MBE2985170.1 PepSY domain-containing protein [Campylobacter sp. RM6883]MBE2987005.1 PepSY domain-containing protein [Campylobacter sp. RM12919]MBE2988650.1 PepSY domain-containing protein [Campylobacter sp. RM12920]MBE2995247.1 PepSY domain-containing protein [Campylobacter sp. RM6913]MBE3029889.1 PepSY domain-containing protein [Campylobacter sp. RM9344]